MSYKKGLVATLAELEDFYRGQNAGDILELMNKNNDILNDIRWMESNLTDGHKTRIRTGLPAVYWRRLYKGVPVSKSEWAEVKEATSMLEARSVLDVKELALYADNARAYRASEDTAFLESMRQKVATTIFYGDSSKAKDEFNGLAMRYPSVNSPNVVDAGGTGSKLTSLWLICWGERTVHGLYPKGSNAGLESKDLGETTVRDDDGLEFEAVITRYNWNVGLAVRDWRAVVRVGNIDLDAITKKDEDGNFEVDLQALTIRAKNKMPINMRSQAIWYCNDEFLTALEIQSIDKGNVNLTYGEYFNAKAIPVLHGRPIRQSDAISTNEKPLATK